LLPPELEEKIRWQLDCLAESSHDFHPQSNNMVRNLIHPSFCPYVHGESWPGNLAPIEHGFSRDDGQLHFDLGEVSKSDYFAHCLVGVKEWSRYQFLPAEVDVDEDGSAKFASYVNNAPDDPELCRMLEDTLSRILPYFEKVVTPPGTRRFVSLRNRRLQVIVKAANYELMPGQSYEGGWHVEGMLHERIIATGIVYYAASVNMRGEGLAFRRFRNRNVNAVRRIPTTDLGGNDYAENDDNVSVGVTDAPWHSTTLGETNDSNEQKMEEDSDKREGTHVPTGFTHPKYSFSGEDAHVGSLWDVGYKSQSMHNYVDLGVVETPPGRVLVFKNSLQHRVSILTNSSTTEKAFRKVLLFWLVDPDKRILSTADVPRQQWDYMRVQIAHTLHRQWHPSCKQCRFPVKLTKLVLDFAKYGFTDEEARQHRLNLMEERKFSRVAINKKFQALIEREYSFCEH